MTTLIGQVVDRSWEKCARLLSLNSPIELKFIDETARTLIKNIVENPTEEKYRTVKCSNKFLNQKILSKSGGADFLLCAGFIAGIDEETGLKILSYTPRNNYNPKKSKLVSKEDKKELEDCLEWLSSTVQDCVELWKIKKSRNLRLTEDDSCAECIIQIKLPTGISVSGGFMGNDLFLDVKNFAKAFFNEQRAPDVTIVFPHSVTSSLEDESTTEQRTLLDLGLAYRASLVAVLATADTSQAFKSKPVVNADGSSSKPSKPKEVSVAKEKASAKADRLKEEERRKQILEDFKEDHRKY